MGFALFTFSFFSRYGILNLLFLNSQDNSLQAVWPRRDGDRKLIRLVLVIGGSMTKIQCESSTSCDYFAVLMLLVTGFQSLILGSEWTVVSKILSINGEVLFFIFSQMLTKYGLYELKLYELPYDR